jgi:hypothetical protein
MRPPASFPGNSFCIVAVTVAAESVQLAVPHMYPVGQHPDTGPASTPQRNQPLAHVVAVGVKALASVTGTTMVAPFVVIVVLAIGGQDVVLQSRPVRQQPEPAVARQP